MLNEIFKFVIFFILGLSGSIYLTPIVIRTALKYRLLDSPEERKVHKYSKPRVGGIAMFVVFIILLLFIDIKSTKIMAIAFGSTSIVFFGLLDDLFNIRAIAKLIFQVLIAYITASNAFGFGINIQELTIYSGYTIQLGLFSIPFTIAWIIGIMNAINLIDGLDGLAGGISIIASITMAIASIIFGQPMAALIFVLLASVILGFLRYNFNPAKVFMGDSGSLFLGYTLSVTSIIGIWNSEKVFGFAIPLIVLGIPIYDVITSIMRRRKNNKPIFHADGEHIHHRIMALGFSHKQTVVIIYLENIFLAIAAFFITLISNKIAPFAFIITIILLSYSFIYIKKQYKES